MAAEKVLVPDLDLDPKVNAARMGIYGPLTRQTTPWRPARLLCKRFSVREPDDDPVIIPTTTTSTARAPDDVQKHQRDRDMMITTTTTTTTLGLGEDDDRQARDVLTYERPALDVFKAIFASDDEEEEGSSSSPSPSPEPEPEPAQMPTVEAKKDNTPVDPETFKPTFHPRKQVQQPKDKLRNQGDKDKKPKRKKEKKVLVSFEVDEPELDGNVDAEAAEGGPAKKRKKKERERERERMEVDGDAPVGTIAGVESGPRSGGAKARKRAVDFM